MFFVGVGTAEAAAEFASELGIDPPPCASERRCRRCTRPASSTSHVEPSRSFDDDGGVTMRTRLKAIGEAYKNAADTQNLAPEDIKRIP